MKRKDVGVADLPLESRESNVTLSDDALRWKTISRDTEVDYHIFQATKVSRRHPQTGVVRPFSVLQSPDWVNLIPLTMSGEVLMVRQHRHGVDQLCLEIPGGLVDPGETGREAAARELREEVGASSSSWHFLGSVHPNPAFLTNRCESWLALNTEICCAPQWDEGELIRVETFPISTIPELIARGEITHSLVISAFFFYRERFGGWRLPDYL